MNKKPGKYDVVIIGGGLGGLECGYILSKEGYKVCILEKNQQLGGSLQIFKRDKRIFDTGVHYIGGLDEGQNLNQYFKYFGLMDRLSLHRMELDGFDRVKFYGEDKEYYYSQGYERFIENLVKDFPNEREAIQKYCDKIREICRSFPLYNLEYVESTGTSEMEMQYIGVSAKEFIESLTSNKRLRNVLGGTNGLYAGDGYKTPLYVHALVVNTYIESSWKVNRGGYQIAKFLVKDIKRMGGEVRNQVKVERIGVSGKEAKYVELQTGERVEGDHFISNVHPSNTLDLLKKDSIRKAYRKRIKSLENTVSSFTLYLSIKDKEIPYRPYNIYHHFWPDVWDEIHYNEKDWPRGYILFNNPSGKDFQYADSMILMCYMKYKELQPWADTFNTVGCRNDRGEDYEEFKERKSKMLLELAEKDIPGVKENLIGMYASTPLSYRDYIGNDDGSMYGVEKDHKNPLRSFISPRTKITNLYFTGQNMNVHGMLGVTVGSVVTCSQLIGKKYLLDKIKKAT